jgi:hypothetical protein
LRFYVWQIIIFPVYSRSLLRDHAKLKNVALGKVQFHIFYIILINSISSRVIIIDYERATRDGASLKFFSAEDD